MCASQNPWLLFLTLLNAIIFILVLLLNLSAAPIGVNIFPGLFERDVANVSNLYQLEITPDDKTFGIWGVIYIHQLIWILYSLVSLCRKTSDGPAYINPMLIPPAFYVSYILSLLFNAGWLILWGRLYISISLVFLFLISFTLYFCLAISYQSQERNIHILKTFDRKGDIWALRLLQNSIAIFATWTSVATLLNLGIVLSYASKPKLDISISSTICLGLLAGFIVIYSILDLCVLNKYSHLVFTPYIVLITALVGITVKNWTNSVNSIFTFVLLAVSAIAFLIKLVSLCFHRPAEKSVDYESHVLRDIDETRSLLK